MDAKEFYIYAKWCWENGVKFVPHPITSNGSVLKILMIKEVKQNITTHTTEKLGEEKFTPETVYDKIRELYKAVYFKNNQ